MRQSNNVEEYARQIQKMGSTPTPATQRDPTSPDRVIFARCSMGAGLNLPAAAATRLQFNTINVNTHKIITTGASWQAIMPISAILRVNVRVVFNGTLWAGGQIANLVMTTGTGNYLLDHFDDIPSNNVYLRGAGEIDVKAGESVFFYVYNGSGSDRLVTGNETMNWLTLSLMKAL